MILLDSGAAISFGFLTASMLALWLPQGLNRTGSIPVWIILCALSAASGLYYGVVEVAGILYLLILGVFCYLTSRQPLHTSLRILSACIVFGLVAGLFLHWIPFFHNPLVFDNFFLSDRSSTHTQYLSFDKAAAGLILLAYCGDICRSRNDWKSLLQKSYIISIATVSLTLSLALLSGNIKPDIKFKSAYFTWAWANLFFTCIPEEMLFRGFLQKYLACLYGSHTYKTGILIFIGLFFGLAHAGGGMTYAALASVAGIGYGYAYHSSGKIESAIVTHFLLNTVHFLFFTYPFAR